MDNKINELEALVNLKISAKKTQKLASKYQQKSTCQRNEPLYNLSNKTSYVLQGISVVLALGCAVGLGDKMPAIYYLAFAVVVAALVVVELGKRASMDAFNVSQLADGRTSRIALAGIVLCSVASMVLSYTGAPVVVSKFTEHKPLIDTAALKESHSLKYAAATSPLVLTQNSIEKEVKRVFDNGLKYDKVLRKTRQSSSSKAALKQLRKERTNIANELRDTKARLSADHKEELKAAVASNSAILEKHTNFNSALGLAMSLVAVAIDLLLFFLMRFICSHEYRSQKEYEVAKDEEELVKFLIDEDNQDELLVLEGKLKSKKLAAV